jgi:chromosome segregation ATPase
LQFNELLKENEIRSTEQAVNTLINEVFANKNRVENLQQAQSAAIFKLKEFADKITEEHSAIADTRIALEALNVTLYETQSKLNDVELTDVNTLFKKHMDDVIDIAKSMCLKGDVEIAGTPGPRDVTGYSPPALDELREYKGYY